TQDCPDIRDEGYWSKIERKQLDEDFDQFTSFTVAFRSAAEKDYFEEPPWESMSYLNARECARAFGVRAMMCIRDGRTTEALEDTRTIMRFGGLLQAHPIIVGQMIGVAIRGTGLDTAYSYYVYYRRDAEKMRALARMLDDTAPKMRASLNIEGFRRGEP